MESTNSPNGRTAGGIASRCAMDATQWSGARSGTTTIRPPATLISPVTAGATTASRADCAVRALRRGETRGLADTWLRPTHAYTHAFREVDAQLSARERMVAGLLLTEGRAS